MLQLGGTFFGTCSSLGSATTKVVENCPGFVLYAGASIYVKFVNENSGTVADLQLNVNGTGAKPIKRTSSTSLVSAGSIAAGMVCNFVYDGTNWLWVGQMDTDTNTVPTAYCTTVANSPSKVATCTDYTLQNNSYIHILFKNGNSSAGALTLNINGQGAMPIKINGSVTGQSNYTLPAGTYLAYYDGTAYNIRTDGALPGVMAGNVVSISNNESTITYTMGDGTTASFVVPNTKYTAGSAIDITDNQIINKGVRAVGQGTENGTISVNTGGTTRNVTVKGLNTAAYHSESDFAQASHAHGYVSNTGLVTSTVESVGNGDAILIADASAEDKLIKSTLTFDGTTTNQFLTKAGTWEGAEVYSHPAYTPYAEGLYKITVDNRGHVSTATTVVKADITALGIPAQDTTYEFDGTYNSSSNKAATVSSITSRINALDGTVTGTPGAGKTLTAFSQTDGKVTATFGDISVTKSQINDFEHEHDYAGSDTSGGNAFTANYAITAGNAVNAANATNADEAVHAASAGYAVNAASSQYARNAASAQYARNAASAQYARNAASAGWATYAASAGYAINASSATYSVSAGYAAVANSANISGTASWAVTAGNARYAGTASNAVTAGNAVNAANATKATQDASGNVITETYATKSEVNELLGGADAMVFKGTLGTGGTITTVPIGDYQAGWTYRVITAGTYAGQKCEVGDLLIAINDATAGQSAVNNAHWTVAQTNIDGAVTTTQTSATSGSFAIFSEATTGRVVVKASGVGTATKPIYIDSNGVPQTITSYEGKAGSAGFAASATEARHAASADYTIYSASAGYSVSAAQATHSASANYAASAGTATDNTKLPLAGGQMTGPITWKDGTALPAFTSNPSYLLGIDAFASGGTTKYINVSSLTVAHANSAGYATNANEAVHSVSAGYAANATNATNATTAKYSGSAGYAASAANATNAANATTSKYAGSAGYATYAVTSSYASSAAYANVANTANTTGTASWAVTAGNAKTAGSASHATHAGSAGYAVSAASAGYSITANYALYNGIEYIIGSQTGSTNVWLGTTTDPELYTGKAIAYQLPFAGTGTAATLNLTLADGTTTTGAKNVVINNLSGLTTHYVANSIIFMIYDGTQWRAHGQWNSTYYYESVYTATAAGTAAKVGTSTNYTLESGKYFQVLVVNSNTSKSALTLNINSKGAKPIYINGTASSASNYTLPSGYYLVYYDGTNYYFRTDSKMTGNITGQAGSAAYAASAANATFAASAGYANAAAEAVHAGSAGYAASAAQATHSASAQYAINAASAQYARNAASAGYAASAAQATHAASAQYAISSASAGYSASAAQATHSASANYSASAAQATHAASANYATTTNKLIAVQLTSEDLDNLKDDNLSLYYAAGSNTVTNKPTGVDAFGLRVHRAATGWYVQELFASNTQEKVYIRYYNSSAWTAWKLIPYSDGTGASGTWSISISGKSGSAGYAASAAQATHAASANYAASAAQATHAASAQYAVNAASSQYARNAASAQYARNAASAGYAASAAQATHAASANYSTSAGFATKAAQDGSGNTISATYATKTELNNLIAGADAMVYKGVLSGAETTTYTPAAQRGWTYKVNVAGLINGEPVEAGDMLICCVDDTAAATADNVATVKANWNIIQTNIDGAVTTSQLTSTSGAVAIFANGNGQEVINAVSVGTATKPIYFDTNGVPQTITSYEGKAGSAGYAASAAQATHAASANYSASAAQATHSASANYATTAGNATDNTKVAKAGDTMTGPLVLQHQAGGSKEMNVTYGSTIDYWWGVGTANENHGLYDAKASKWILAASASNAWVLDGKAGSANYAASAAQATHAASAQYAISAASAGYAASAAQATHAASANYAASAAQATHAASAQYAISAASAGYAASAAQATHSASANYAASAAQATHAASAQYALISSANSTSKLFMLGATSQAASGIIPYSHQYVYETDGALSAAKIGINAATTADKVTLQFNSTTNALDFIFA